ncbi:MAG: hypothetical protein O2968_13510, partial [Acidobacteria bacterium]|nr:hypothetical protein [Acidobacteriota bacterium]
MPEHSFFRSLGLFTRPDFLTRPECDALRDVADSSKGEEAKVYKAGQEVVRDDYRKCKRRSENRPQSGDSRPFTGGAK